ncbi:olfactory receptor 14A16-like [Emys orbicularis]|uniref:olfactory receptor 14A16-like n=1 Tax=Emys orbicularis TaxID=82168 RepID=UPI0031FDB7EE
MQFTTGEIVTGIYLVSLTGNQLVIILALLDHHIHTPVYFFLMNLSVLDLGSISLTVPKSVANSLLNTTSISYAGCVTQVFLFIFFTEVDFAFLTIMAYNRYVTICQPLNYEIIMNRRACAQMAASAWITGILLCILHSGNTFAITFCGGNMVGQLYCEIPQILKLACSDLYLGLDLVVSVLYSVVPPLMNPIIYSMRNKEIKCAWKKLTERSLFTKNKISRCLP